MIEAPTTTTKSPKALSAECEALLFVAREPLSQSHLATLTGSTEHAVQKAITSLRRFFRPRGIQLARLPAGYQFTLAPKVETIAHIYRNEPHELSEEATETLAIIAYLQPVDEATIADLRCVSPFHAIETLIAADLISAVVSDDCIKHYVTTEAFLTSADLHSLDDLPLIETPKASPEYSQ